MEQRVCIVGGIFTLNIEKKINDVIGEWGTRGWRVFHAVEVGRDRDTRFLLFFERPRTEMNIPPAPILNERTI